MEKFKDFFYNKNDIVVAVVIFLIAAAVIYFRFNAIMEYPQTLVEAYSGENKSVTTEQNDK
ncbi:MAG: hypothetical protein RR626_08475 [Anaerovoracaceae bacterium]